jgi:hypothetical protein
LGLVWGLGGFDGFDTFFFSLYKALRLRGHDAAVCEPQAIGKDFQATGLEL